MREDAPPDIKRRGRQLGPLDAILRSSGRFTIRYNSDEAFSIALQVSRNLLQYFGADSSLSNSMDELQPGNGNAISLVVGHRLPRGYDEDFPIRLTPDGLCIKKCDDDEVVYPMRKTPAAVFLRPLNNERLELVVWGVDQPSLAFAARLVPMLTGVGQPDFVVLGWHCPWQGAGGAVAMGFFDHSWKVTRASFFE